MLISKIREVQKVCGDALSHYMGLELPVKAQVHIFKPKLMQACGFKEREIHLMYSFLH